MQPKMYYPFLVPITIIFTLIAPSYPIPSVFIQSSDSVQLYQSDGVISNSIAIQNTTLELYEWSTVTFCAERLFVIGGYPNVRELQEYNVMENTVTIPEWLPEGLHFHSSVCQPRLQSIFICGGDNRTSTTNRCVKYDVNRKKWHFLVDMPRTKAMHQSIVDRTRLFVMGGYTHDHPTSRSLPTRTRSTFMYDIRLRQWNFTSNMLHDRANFAISKAHNRLWACGGAMSLTLDCECYDLSTLKWMTGPKLMFARRDHSMHLMNQAMVVIGGRCDGRPCPISIEGDDVMDSVEILELPELESEKQMRDKCGNIITPRVPVKKKVLLLDPLELASVTRASALMELPWILPGRLSRTKPPIITTTTELNTITKYKHEFEASIMSIDIFAEEMLLEDENEETDLYADSTITMSPKSDKQSSSNTLNPWRFIKIQLFNLLMFTCLIGTMVFIYKHFCTVLHRIERFRIVENS